MSFFVRGEWENKGLNFKFVTNLNKNMSFVNKFKKGA